MQTIIHPDDRARGCTILVFTGRCPGGNRGKPAVSDRNRDLCPGTAQDIVVPSGYQVSVFAQGLNQPTGIAFLGTKSNFNV